MFGSEREEVAGNPILGSFISAPYFKYQSVQINEVRICGVCSLRGRNEEFIPNFFGECEVRRPFWET
jgi:hypothetical protein